MSLGTKSKSKKLETITQSTMMPLERIHELSSNSSE